MTSLRVWLEDKDQRCIVTGDGVVTAQRGDLVAVVIVKRWEDVHQALGAIGALTAPPAEPETP